MRPRERAAFVDAYSRILTRAWSDERFAARLEADPRGELAEYGLHVPLDAELSVTRESHGEPDLEALLTRWCAGQETGRFELCVPVTPQLLTKELSEADLAVVSAGTAGACCSCCPCCCST